MRTVRKFGYARVSARDQNEARQLAVLAGCGIPPGNLFVEKCSGRDFSRPAYQRMFQRLGAGDVLFVLSIDRLGRNYDEILDQWRKITREKGADIVVLDFPLLDTRAKESGQDLTGRFVADLVLQILAYVAQKEREDIHQRQAEGIAAARARGQRLGRPAAHLPEGFAALCEARLRGELGAGEIIAQCGMKRSTFYKYLREFRREQEGDMAYCPDGKQGGPPLQGDRGPCGKRPPNPPCIEGVKMV